METLAMQFRDKLIRMCEARGWSQSDLWRAVGGVSRNTVSRWWNGDVKPFDDASVRLARALRTSLDYLADDAMDEVPAAKETAGDDAYVLRVVRDLGLGPDEVIRRLYLDQVPFKRASPPEGEEPEQLKARRI
jgi:transcriptional regulator with XRE-family HTH domain